MALDTDALYYKVFHILDAIPGLPGMAAGRIATMVVREVKRERAAENARILARDIGPGRK